MKKNTIISTIVSVALVTGVTTTIVNAADAGTSSDPLVTKSYVDSKITELKNTLTTTISQMGQDGNNNNNNNNSNNNNTSTSDAQYKVVLVPKGSSIIGGEGTELILRSGKASVVSTTSNGLVNMTTGVDALNGTDVPKNNLMIVPRPDGRGFKVTSDNTNVMVRGSYEIK